MTVVIGELRFGKRPGTDDINGSVTIEYTGNVSIELRTVISLAGTGYIIADDTRTWNEGDPPADISGSIVTPDLPYGFYGGVCQVIRTDTSAVIASEAILNAIEIMQRKVFGYVLDSIIGIPILGATVTLQFANMTTLTDVNGYFEFIDPPFTGIDIITGSQAGSTTNFGDITLPGPSSQQEVTIYIGAELVVAEITGFTIS